MIGDVETHVLTVADVAVFDGGTRPLAAHTHSRPHGTDKVRVGALVIDSATKTKPPTHTHTPVHVERMMQWSMLGLQLTVISRQWWAL